MVRSGCLCLLHNGKVGTNISGSSWPIGQLCQTSAQLPRQLCAHTGAARTWGCRYPLHLFFPFFSESIIHSQSSSTSYLHSIIHSHSTTIISIIFSSLGTFITSTSSFIASFHINSSIHLHTISLHITSSSL